MPILLRLDDLGSWRWQNVSLLVRPLDQREGYFRVCPDPAVLVPRRRRRQNLVSDGFTRHAWIRDIHGNLGPVEVVEYIDLWQRLQGIHLNQVPDRINSKWTANDVYSAKSCYKALFNGLTFRLAWQFIWKAWAPLRNKFFLWLASLDRCWTVEQRTWHCLAHDPECTFCSQELETINNLPAGYVLADHLAQDSFMVPTCSPNPSTAR